MTRTTSGQPDAAATIREALASVTALRNEQESNPPLQQAVKRIKRVQAQRFAGTYADLLAGPPYQDAARFFLEELYGDRDYAERDAQFARIAGAIQKLFPEQVSATAAALAQLHALTEHLDHGLAQAWLAETQPHIPVARLYVLAWRAVGQRSERLSQLAMVLDIGRELSRLTRLPGLRLLLKMMRGPAAAGGMASLQHFLEAGFDTFAAMARRRNGAQEFLGLVQGRETQWIERLFDADLVACETALSEVLGQAR